MIAERYFDEELQYHFEDTHWKIRFSLKDDGRTLCVDQWTTGCICPSPNHPNAELVQSMKIRGQGSAELKELTIGSRDMVKGGKLNSGFEDRNRNRTKEIKVSLSEGVGDLESERSDVSKSESYDGHLHWAWEVASRGRLLLPGHSSTIIIIGPEGA